MPSFDISTENYPIITEINTEEYDAENYTWHGTAHISIGDSFIQIPFRIPYEDWIGEELSVSSVAEYGILYASIDYWTELLTDYVGAFTLVFNDVSIAIKLDENSYELMVPGYTVIRNDYLLRNYV